MNSHVPFDACQPGWGYPTCGQNSSNDPLVDKMIGNAYHVVRTVYCNLGNLKLIYDFLQQYGMVLGVQSEAELKDLTTSATYARIYGFDNTNKRMVTDYLYVEGDMTGIVPNDPTATGSWIEVANSTTGGGGEDDGEASPPYMPYVYNNGSAIGGETTIPVPVGTIGVPFIINEGYMQTVGYGFEFNATTLTVTLAQPLEPGDEIVLLLTGTPAIPDNPNVTDWIQINWLYNGGYASGGEQVIQIPYTFQSVPAVYKNGERYYQGLADKSYTVDAPNQRILLTEPLVTNDRLIVTIGGEEQIVIMSDHTIQEVARATNVKDSEVIKSTNTTQYLNGMKVVYDEVAQKIYGLPSLPTNVYISSVSNGELTYSPGNITVDLLPAPGTQDAIEVVQDNVDALADTLATETGPYPALAGGTNLYSKIQHANRVLSIADFGTPATDSGNSANLALSWLTAQGDAFARGGTAKVPRGVNPVTTTILLDRTAGGADVSDYFTLEGDGLGATELRAAAGLSPTSAIIKTNEPTGNFIQSYRLANLGTRGGYNGVRIETASRGSMERVKVENSTNDGIYIGNSWVNNFKGLLINNSGQHGIYFDPLPNKQKTSTHIDGGYVNTTVADGIVLGFMNYSLLSAVAVDAAGQNAYHIKNSESLVLNACGNEGAQRAGIYAEASAAIGPNNSVTINGHFSHNSNLGNNGWANLLHLKSIDGTTNRVRINNSTSHAPTGNEADIVADGVGAIATVDGCTLPKGVKTYNGGYIDWVHHPLLVNNKAIAATTATIVCKLGSTQGHTTNLSGDTSCFAGEITVVASTSAPSTAVRRIAVYKLLVSVTAEQGKEVEVIKQLGYLSGNVAGAPSFTWTINSANMLVATPIGSAAGNFWFEITTDSQVVASV